MEEINILEVLNYFKSKIIWIIASVILVVLLGNAFTFVTREPMYKSNTTILLVSEQTSQSDLSMNTNLVSTYTEIIKSRRVLNQVIENLQLDYSIEELSNNISVGTKQNTQIITITVVDTNATDAKNIANELSIVFANDVKEIYNLDNVTIIDRAIEAKAPYNLTYVKDNLIYVAIAIVLSCGIIFVVYYFDTTIKSTEVIEEKLGLTIIGVVPEERRGR